MSSLSLFFNRLSKELRFQYRILNTVLDWTVLVYLIMPAVVIFCFTYRSWWIAPPSWSNLLTISLLFGVTYFFAWRGNIRTFLLDADRVFLIKNRQLFFGLKKVSYMYSLFVCAIQIICIIAVLLPFMVQRFELSFLQIFVFSLFFISLKWLLLYIKRKINSIERRFIKMISSRCIFSLFGAVVLGVTILFIYEFVWLIFGLSIVIMIIAISFYLPSLSKITTFEQDLIIDQEEQGKWIKFIYLFSFELEKTHVSTAKKPLLLRKSFRLFKKRTPKNGFIELFIKVFIRDSNYWTSYLQLMGTTAFALLIVPPTWLKIIIYFGFLFIMSIWLNSIWDKITKSHPLFKKYSEQDAFFNAKRTVALFMWLFSGLITGCVIICSIF